MPKVTVYLPEALHSRVKKADLNVSAVCQGALERALQDVEQPRLERHG